MRDAAEFAPPTSLLIAHAPARERAWHRLCWHIDGLMARTVLGAQEGAIAAIRLAWWEEALSAGGPTGQRDPVLLHWWHLEPAAQDRAAVATLAGAWRALLDPSPMTEADWAAFGAGRGALLALLSRTEAAGTEAAGASLWGLWDMARIAPDRQRAEGAFAAAIGSLQSVDPAEMRLLPKPCRLAVGMALDDVRAHRLPMPDFGWRQYLRFLGRAITG